MKKIIILFVMLLGGITMISAQTLNNKLRVVVAPEILAMCDDQGGDYIQFGYYYYLDNNSPMVNYEFFISLRSNGEHIVSQMGSGQVETRTTSGGIEFDFPIGYNSGRPIIAKGTAHTVLHDGSYPRTYLDGIETSGGVTMVNIVYSGSPYYLEVK